MSEAFIKALKWFFLALCAVIGTSAFILADERGTIKPVAIGILAFGVLYITSYFWKMFRKRTLFMCVIIFLVISFAAPYVPVALYILFGYPMEFFDPYYTWAGTIFAVGLPVMTVYFYRYD
ncbi:MAG: hypothetical protein GC137_09235 [Alphaproteobacteria bacterium]|nr:hypothetical protein [Alphaproteobacteria bacterium]